MRRDIGAFVFGVSLMAVGALLWMRVVVSCERLQAGESATCVVTQKRLFGLVPFARWTSEGVRRATHEVVHGSRESQSKPGYQPSWMLVLDTKTRWQPVESGWSEAVGLAEAELNVLLTSQAAGRADATIGVWMPGVFALLVGLIPAFAGGQRALIRRRGGNPDARPRRAKRQRSG